MTHKLQPGTNAEPGKHNASFFLGGGGERKESSMHCFVIQHKHTKNKQTSSKLTSSLVDDHMGQL